MLSAYGYNFDIDWGDGGVVEHYDNKIEIDSIPHTYSIAGVYIIKKVGICPIIQCGFNTYLKEVIQVGNLDYNDLLLTFSGSPNLESVFFNALVRPNVPMGCLSVCGKLNQVIGLSNLKNVTSVSNLFYETAITDFNTSDMTKVIRCRNAWGGNTNLKTFDASGLVSVKNCERAWDGCTGLTSFINIPDSLRLATGWNPPLNPPLNV